MEGEYRLRLGGWPEILFAAFVGLLGAGIVGAGILQPPDDFAPQLTYACGGILIAVGILWGGVSLFRMRDIVTADSFGIRYSRGSRVLWDLPWDRIAGFKSVVPKENRGLLAPQVMDLLDSDGKPLRRLNMGQVFTPERRTMIAAFAQLIVLHSRPDMVPAVRSRNSLTPLYERLGKTAVVLPPVIALGLLGVAFCFAEAFIGNGSLGTELVLPSIISVVGGLGIALGILAVRAGLAPFVEAPPASGLSYEEFFDAHLGRLAADPLNENVRYRYVHPSALRASVNEQTKLNTAFLCLISLQAVEGVVGLWVHHREGILAVIAFELFYALMFWFFFSLTARLRIFAKGLDSEFSVTGNLLTAGNGDSRRVFDLTKVKSRRSILFSRVGLHGLSLRDEFGQFYLDDRYLIEVGAVEIPTTSQISSSTSPAA